MVNLSPLLCSSKYKTESRDTVDISVPDVPDELELPDELDVPDELDELQTTSSLEGLQTDEQRRVLDIIAQLRKCGLESVLSLPQLVVCGDQSAGKSSVLEALTEIPFPRNDNLCTRFATEIILRRAVTNSLTIKVIADTKRPSNEQEAIGAFEESITNFDELPRVMTEAMKVMGLDSLDSTSISASNAKAFAKDVLSILIEGPSRPQLTLVDLPGLIQNQTKGVTEADVDMVKEITDSYICKPRTICLAVITATNDYANQVIVTKVQKVDPNGNRTLGIITKPDRLPAGSGSEQAFLNLARNGDIFFSLGWHVLKNRAFEEGGCSLLERNASEAAFFRKSNFKTLPGECVGIDSLRHRLSQLLFDHIKQELPQLREDLDTALADTKSELSTLGDCRTTAQDCRTYLMQLSLGYRDVCRAAVGGNYEGDYFKHNTDNSFSVSSSSTIRRLRAVIQYMNTQFSDTVRTRGHKYHVKVSGDLKHPEIPPLADEPCEDSSDEDITPHASNTHNSLSALNSMEPTKLSKSQALAWVKQVLTRTRGKELPGNFNPLLIGELFWEQSSKWRRLAADHLEKVASVCSRFAADFFQQNCPKDVHSRLWSSKIQGEMKTRTKAAVEEMDRIMMDLQHYPINYNHYYTDTVKKRRQARHKESLADIVEGATSLTHPDAFSRSTSIDVDKVVGQYSERIDPDMEKHSCEEALDCLFSIYKASPRPLQS